MTPDAFSEQRLPAPPLALDPHRTAVIVVDMVNEFFEPGGKMVLAGGTALYAPVNALVDAAHTAHLPVFYTNQWLRPDDVLLHIAPSGRALGTSTLASGAGSWCA